MADSQTRPDTQPRPQSPPKGFARITPAVIVNGGARAVEFYQKAFGAEPVQLYYGPDGTLLHGELSFDGMMVYVCDEMREYDLIAPSTAGGVTSSFTWYGDDPDARFERAVAAGATVLEAMSDSFTGDRAGTVRCPFGHRWNLARHDRDVPDAEIRAHIDAWIQSKG